MIATIAFFKNYWPFMIAALAGALLAFGPVYIYGKSAGKTETVATAAKEALARIQQMEKTDANWKSKTDRERCVSVMRDSGLRPENCD